MKHGHFLYYVARANITTQWKRPKIELQHLYYYQVSLLSTFATEMCPTYNNNPLLPITDQDMMNINISVTTKYNCATKMQHIPGLYDEIYLRCLGPA